LRLVSPGVASYCNVRCKPIIFTDRFHCTSRALRCRCRCISSWSDATRRLGYQLLCRRDRYVNACAARGVGLPASLTIWRCHLLAATPVHLPLHSVPIRVSQRRPRHSAPVRHPIIICTCNMHCNKLRKSQLQSVVSCYLYNGACTLRLA
jgi:hypothetical protein